MRWKQTWSASIIIFLCFTVTATVNSQPQVEFLGLEGKLITSLGIYGSAIVVGTNGDGVFYQYVSNLPDSSWTNAGLEGKNVTAVYPHNSGPVGWGITAGIFPEGDDSNYVYCSFMGDEFVPNSAGISDSLAEGVYRLAGFPDPTICGEKYAATGRALYRQLWGDTTWVPIYSDGLWQGDLIYVKTKEDIGGFVLAGGSAGYTGILLVKSTDYGDTWEHIYPPGPAIAFDFDVDSTNSNFGMIFVSHGREISRSLDGGSTWSIVHEDGWNYFSKIVYDPNSSLVFAAGGDGLDTSSAVLFFSEDLGENWYQVPLSFGGPIVGIDLTWDGYLYLAAPWSGVHRINLDELSIDDLHLPLTFALHQNFPNPFNSTTTIHFDLPEAADVQLVIYDILGRKVEILVSDQLVSGKYEVVWDASNVVSGVYFYRLTINNSSAGSFGQITKKMVLLK